MNAPAVRRLPALLSWVVCGIVLTGTGVFFRVWHLSNVPGVNGDEAFWGIKALRLLRGEHAGWRSNSGNLADVFYLLPLTGLHVLFAPSVALLRSVSVLTGVLLLPVNWVLCRRVFGRMTAGLSTVLLAVLPTNIAYSRFGWEPSQSVLACAIVLYLCLLLVQGKTHALKGTALCVLAFGCACDVHPTNVFVGPFVLFAVLLRVRQSECGRRSKVVRTLVYSVPLLALAVLLALMPRLLAGALEPRAAAGFGIGCLRLFSGVTVYRYIAGSVPPALWAWDTGTGVAFALAAGSLLLLAKRNADTARGDLFLLGSGIVCLAGFYVVAGAFAVSPSHERYALWMMAPGTLVLARGAALALAAFPVARPAVLTAGTVAGMVLLAGFGVFYFQFMQSTGGQAHETFRTAAAEPKRAALTFILAHRTGTPTLVVASEWWNYQPLFYLAANAPDVRVLTLQEWNGSLSSQQRKGALRSGTVWVAEFADSANAARLRQTLTAAHIPFEQPTVNDYAHKPVLVLIHPLPH